MDTEIREKFSKIPFGLLSGLSTCLSTILFLLVISTVKHFNLFALTQNLLALGSILAIALDGLLIFYELALNKVRKLYPKNKRNIILLPQKNSIPLLGFCFFEGLFEFYLIQNSLDYGVSLFSAFLAINSARVVGSLLIGVLSDYVGTKGSLVFSTFATFLALFSIQFPEIIGLVPQAKLAYKILAMKGCFGCLFVLIKREMMMSATIKFEEGVTHEF